MNVFDPLVPRLLEMAHQTPITTAREPFRMADFDPNKAPLAHVLPLFFPDISEWYGCYFLFYGPGADKAPHRDPVAEGKRHDRLIVLLQAADEGGELLIAGDPLPMVVGDAFLFRADVVEHAVSKVVRGERIVMTIGAVSRNIG